MPNYDFFCEKCKAEVLLTLTMSERARGDYRCPTCGSTALRPLMSAFFSKTSRKA